MSGAGVCGMLGAVSLALLASCGGGGDSTVAVQGASPDVLLNPLKMQQFANPLPIIPAATPDTKTSPGSDYYTVVAEQTPNYDFGLRQKDGSNFVNPATGAPIRTTVWGYTVNGIKAGYLGATIEAHSTLDASGRKVVVKYTNNLRNSDGTLLTKHLLTVDPTLGGADQGEPEVRIVTHLHGGHTDPGSDGYPMSWVTNDPSAATGMPADPVTGDPGRPSGNTFTYTYRNDQLATHLWFHDHAMGITRLNAYAGLAANYIIRDDFENSLGLPSGVYEIPLVVQDKSFNQDGSMHYPAKALLDNTGEQVVVKGQKVLSSKPEFFGNTILVNGKAWPFLVVEPRKYKFRFLNGSDSRFFNLWLEASSGVIQPDAIQVIANEGGLLPATLRTAGYTDDTALLMAPAERYDVVVDFSKFPTGATLTLRNDAATPYPSGDPVADNTTGRIMQFRITKTLVGTDTSTVPANPRPVQRPTGRTVSEDWDSPSKTVFMDLQEFEEPNRFLFDDDTGTVQPRLKQQVNGRTFFAGFDPNELHHLNAIEDWVIINSTGDIHPMHVHLVNFEVVEKGTILASDYTPADPTHLASVTGGLSGLIPNVDDLGHDVTLVPGSPYRVNGEELGWKETVRVPAASYGVVGFADRVGYVRVRAKFDILGTYMFHCHILAHEENEMMRPFMVVP
jgi:spore coat protein A, manganese oxidase